MEQIVIVVLTDTRGAIVFSLIAVASSIMINKSRNFLILKSLPLIFILAPIILVLVLPQLASFNIFKGISRGESDIASGNSRFIIWGVAGNDLVNGNSLTIFGLGEGGIYKTDSFLVLSEFFEGVADNKGRVLVHPHNSLIAMLYDNGVIAVLLYVIMLVSLVRTLMKKWKYNYKLFTIASAALIYLILIGTTESFIGFYYQHAIIIFIYIYSLLFTLKNINNGFQVKTKILQTNA
jgi:O-antigen ligase